MFLLRIWNITARLWLLTLSMKFQMTFSQSYKSILPVTRWISAFQSGMVYVYMKLQGVKSQDLSVQLHLVRKLFLQ